MSETDVTTPGTEVIEPDEVEPPDGPHGLLAGRIDGSAPSGATPTGDEVPEITSPAKIIRIGAMAKQLLEEVRNTPLDEAYRGQLRDIYDRSLEQLKSALSPELAEELDELSFEFATSDVPTESEIRMAQSQLVGWLEGLFHGIQTALFAQQMAVQQQLQGMRRALPPGHGDDGAQGQQPGGERGPTGQYL